MIYSTIYYITTRFFEFFMGLNLFHIHFNLDAVRLWSNILPSLEWAFPWIRFPLIKFFHPYPTMVKPGTVLYYLKRKIKKIKITWYTPWVLLRSVFLLQKLSTFAISKDRNKDLISTSYCFSWVLEVVLINLVLILMSLKLMTLETFIKYGYFEGYGNIIFVHDITNKVLSHGKLLWRCGHVTKVW